MIISLSGLTGSGKTLTMVMLCDKEGRNKKVMTNINGLKLDHHRLKKSNLFKKILDEKKTNSKTTYYKIDVNWDFWIENAGCTIMLDEAHNIIEARDFSSAENKCASKWVAQIRKVCQDTGDFRLLTKARKFNNNLFSKFIYEIVTKHNNLYITSQTTSRLEKNFRDLSNIHIHCTCQHVGDVMLVYNYFYFSDEFNSAIENFINGYTKAKLACFIANPYFDKYDRYMIIGSDSDYL